MYDLVRITPGERADLYEERRRAIREAPGIWMSDVGRYAVGPGRVRGELHVHGRDRDGCLLASVYVTHGASGAARYLRRLRVTPAGGQHQRRVKLKRRT